MHESSTDADALTIPAEAIYKVFRYDSDGEVSQIYIFSGGLKGESDASELFSAPQLDFIRKKKVQLNFSKYQIHADDAIRDVKKKLIHEIGVNNVAYDEIYLYCFVEEWIRLDAIYREITHSATDSVSPGTFAQLAENLAVPDSILAEIPIKSTYEYEDMLAFDQGRTNPNIRIRTSLGRRFVHRRDHTFSANPYRVVAAAFEATEETRLDCFENELLLDYGEISDHEIHICLAKDVLSFFDNSDINTRYLANIYYPRLFSQGVIDLHTLAMRRQAMRDENVVTEFSLNSYRTVDIFHQIYYNRTSEMQYISKGIKSFSITVAHPHPRAISLDALFRQMHATANMPFLVYSPAAIQGVRKENLIRMHSNRISKTGKKIPTINSVDVLRLARDIPVKNQITALLQISGLFVVAGIAGDGSLYVRGSSTNAMDIDQWDLRITAPIQDFVGSVNSILYSTGYTVPAFLGICHPTNKTTDINYSVSLAVIRNASLKYHIKCIRSIFTVLDDKLANASLRLRRVGNFQEMDERNAFIASIYKDPLQNAGDAVADIMREFGISKEVAIAAYSDRLKESSRIQAHAHDSPGFAVKCFLSPSDNILSIEVFSITNPRYIPEISVYLDTLIRMTQFADTTKIERHIFSTKCSGPPSALDLPIKNNVEVLMETVAEKKVVRSIKAVEFLDIEADVADSGGDDDDGFLFSEYDDYNDAEDEPESVPVVLPPPVNEDISVDGMRINDPSFFFARIKKREPAIILSKKEGKYDAYARVCPANAGRQPVILSAEEKARIDKEHPGSYNHALKYGSDPANPNWYICPRFWCFKTGTSMTKEEVDSGICGGIIPKSASVVPKGSYVYEFTSGKHMPGDNSEYVEHTPGFLKKDTHPKFALPCCFSSEWSSSHMEARRREAGYVDDDPNSYKTPAAKQNRNSTYIISAENIPISEKRWGFLPSCALKFLHSDYKTSVKNLHHIVEGVPCFLRYGVEQTSENNQSFIGCLAEFYAYNHNLLSVPSVRDMREILAKSLSLDTFIRYHNGTLASIFQPTNIRAEDIDTTVYSDSNFFKSLDLADDTQFDFLENTVAAFEHFLKFLRDQSEAIEHTYLWDIFADDNKLLMLGGANLVILNVPNDDVTDNIEMLCPTYAHSGTTFDPEKETFLLLKQGKFYEPIYLYEERTTKISVVKAFARQTVPNNITNLITLIKKTTDKYCSPQSSIPRSIYTFKRNISAEQVVDILVRRRATVHQQVINYQTKVVSIIASFDRTTTASITIPCLPSAAIDGIPIIYMDNETVWRDYRTTIRLLTRVKENTEGEILCAPQLKVVDDGMIVGVLTETNQFVSISPPAFMSDIIGDELPSFSGENYVLADKAIATGTLPDTERMREVQKIFLEGEFYSTFRAIARQKINDFKHRNSRKRIVDMIASPKYAYREKLRMVIAEMRKILNEKVVFQQIEESALIALTGVVGCPDIPRNTTPAYCVSSKKTGTSLFIVPDKNLLSGNDNDKHYYARISDELIRYHRTRLFMFNPKVYMNTASPSYAILTNEILAFQSSLVRDYATESAYDSQYVNNIVHTTAIPSIAPTISNEVTIGEQDSMVSETTKKRVMMDTTEEIEDAKKCMSEHLRIKGNRQTSIWVRSFPYTAKEIHFYQNAHCSFALIASIMQKISPNTSIALIKESLCIEYAKLLPLYASKIISILKVQGKRGMMARIENGSTELDALISSDEYYITDLDLWVYFQTTRVPVIIFYSTVCKMIVGSDIDWLFLGGNHIGDIYGHIHFIRSPAKIDIDLPHAYSVISGSYKYQEMGEFSATIREALIDPEKFVPNTQSLDVFLKNVEMVKRRRS